MKKSLLLLFVALSLASSAALAVAEPLEVSRTIRWRAADGGEASATENFRGDEDRNALEYRIVTSGGSRIFLREVFEARKGRFTVKLQDEQSGWTASLELSTTLGDLGRADEFDFRKFGTVVDRMKAEDPLISYRFQTSSGPLREVEVRASSQTDPLKELAVAFGAKEDLAKIPATAREAVRFLGSIIKGSQIRGATYPAANTTDLIRILNAGWKAHPKGAEEEAEVTEWQVEPSS